MSFRDEVADAVEEFLRAKYSCSTTEEYHGYCEVAGGTGYFVVRNIRPGFDQYVMVEVNYE